MPFYQNPFPSEFVGVLLLSDRQYNITFRVPANTNRSDFMAAWGTAPYNTVGNTTLTINYSIDSGASYYALSVSVPSGSAVTVDQIVTLLSANTNFTALFTASNQNGVLVFRSIAPREKFKCYINNTSAETVLQFNKKAGVAQLPSYFARHTIANKDAFPGACAHLVQLTQPTMDYAITNAGISTTALEDYQLLAGRSGLFTFKKITVDGSNRITAIIEYPAGAAVGDLAKKTTYSYTAANTNPDKIVEIPYVMTLSDFVTP